MKKVAYTETQMRLAQVLKALGHPARVAIMDHLLKVNACICGDIVNELPLAQPTVSQHLKELKNAGLIQGSIEGNTICYCIDPQDVAELRDYLQNMVETLNPEPEKSCGNKGNIAANFAIKEMVKAKYSLIAAQSPASQNSCCAQDSSPQKIYHIMTDEYNNLAGYNPAADLQLGCGLPTKFARINPGDVVVDLGSGAGNDCFVARHETGVKGKVIGIDFSAAMVQKARQNAQQKNFDNVEFIVGDIEDIPLPKATAQVVVSNCVMNLVPDKVQAFREVFRILKPGGHFSISDIVLTGDLPAKIKNAAEMYAGCVASAILQSDYLEIIKQAGFSNLTIQKNKPIIVPEHILKDYLNPDEIAAYSSRETVIRSLSIYAEKPRD